MAVPKVEVVVLGLLAEEQLYGYELLERFRARSMGFWIEVGKASVYQTLHRLERDGFVSGRAQEGTDGPDRRVFRITKAGLVRLRLGLEERFGELAPYETEAGTALGFANLLAVSETRAAVDARVRAVRDLLDSLASERSRTAGERGSSRVVSNAMLDRQEALAKAELAWLGAFRRRVGRR